ncbi:MAG: hypothetical protein C0407_04315 [Desulfobacca sp.]|nr:hypothetical protein [Desulfobacca sp.]
MKIVQIEDTNVNRFSRPGWCKISNEDSQQDHQGQYCFFHEISSFDTKLRFKVQGIRFKVQGIRFKVQGSRSKVQGPRYKASGKPIFRP